MGQREADAHGERPQIASIAESSELRRWYWLKKELVAEARRVGVKTTGAKFTVLDRLCHRLDTGETTWPGDVKTKPTSTFDWHSAPLEASTVITDSYRNTQSVRRWFVANVDPKFKFNIAFMEWIKANAGKTLGDAGAEYLNQKAAAARPGFETTIKPHNQFNQYTRDFLSDNPDLGMADVRRVWALKRRRPSPDGRHVYERSDLALRADDQ